MNASTEFVDSSKNKSEKWYWCKLKLAEFLARQ